MGSAPRALPDRSFMVSIALIGCFWAMLLGSAYAAGQPAGIQIRGSGTPPQLAFACCDRGIAPMQALFADHDVVAALKELHAQVGLAVADFSPQRAQVVRFLNQQQIPVIAGVTLQTKDGPYFNADDVAEAPAQIAAFENWTRENGLSWTAVGLDIEPNFSELAALRKHPWRLFTTLLSNSFDGKRIARAQEAYSALIRQMQAQGYPVETYTMPYAPLERKLHTALLDRLLGTVEVAGNENDVMIYTSFARPVGSAIIADLGPYSQGIIVGVTDGLTPAGSGFGPLDWEEFSSDLIVASHFAHHIGVYNLEGCVRRGYLARLEQMNWGATVVIPPASASRARRHVLIFCAALLVGANLPYLAAALLLLVAGIVWRRARRRSRYARG